MSDQGASPRKHISPAEIERIVAAVVATVKNAECGQPAFEAAAQRLMVPFVEQYVRRGYDEINRATDPAHLWEIVASLIGWTMAQVACNAPEAERAQQLTSLMSDALAHALHIVDGQELIKPFVEAGGTA